MKLNFTSLQVGRTVFIEHLIQSCSFVIVMGAEAGHGAFTHLTLASTEAALPIYLI